MLNKTIVVISLLLIVILPIYLYNYILFSPLSCQWSSATSTKVVLIADPQMEGDTRVLRQGSYGQFHNDFNDWYFWLVQRNVNTFLKPHFEFILGDLYSSQYTDQEEFKIRKQRFWNIFKHNESETKMVTLVGNHDTGYGAECRMADYRFWRFVVNFGQQNGVEEAGDHVLAYVNSLILDLSPLVFENHVNNEAWKLLHELANRTDEKPIILFTHIPLYKPDGACHDNFSLERLPENGHILEQTMLTRETSDFILNQVKPKYIFNGHDHYGCYYYHNQSGTHEYTIRSIMGDYGGNIALFEYELNKKTSKVEYTVKQCSFFYTKAVMIYMAIAILWVALVIISLPIRLFLWLLCGTRSTKPKQD